MRQMCERLGSTDVVQPGKLHTSSLVSEEWVKLELEMEWPAWANIS